MAKRFEVVNTRTGERFGNHTHAEAVRRTQVMRRNWNYRDNFEVMEIERDERATA